MRCTLQQDERSPGTEQEWIRRAVGHLAMARQGKPKGGNWEDLAFHAQQCAEFALKAVHQFRGLPFRRTHSIEELGSRLESEGIQVPDELREAAVLTRYAVRARYPGVGPAVTHRHVGRAVELAAGVLEWARNHLGGQLELVPEPPAERRPGDEPADRFPTPQPVEIFEFRSINYSKSDHRATVTINRPDVLNCLDFPTLREMSRAFEDASWDDSIRVVVLTGAGERAFCTGADLKEQAEHCLENPNAYWKWMGAFIEAHDRLRNIGKVTIARLNGIVVGGGNEFNMACDLAVMVEDAYIRHVGTARGSVPAGGATQWLPLIVGDRRAREILFLCEEIPAGKALEWGLVNCVVPRNKLDATVDELCEKLTNKLPECTRYAKQQLNFWRDFSWHLTVGHARDWLAIHNLSPEVIEGIRAFEEKRPVDYERLRKTIGDRTA